MRWTRVILVAVLVCGAAEVARAETSPAFSTAIEWRPLPLFQEGAFSASFERAAGPKMGWTVGLSVGPTLFGTNGGIRFYPVGDFGNGLIVEIAGSVGTAVVNGVSASLVGLEPSVGYKFTAPVGFTLEGGVGYLVAIATAGEESIAAGGIVFGLGAGWSF